MLSQTPKPKIAIVDDDLQTRQHLAAPLRGDYEVLEAADHDGAYRLLREHEPDILLLDLNLPSGSVRECVALLNDLTQSDLDTLIIVLSDDRTKSTALKVMDAGAYDYFVKPFDPDLMRTIIDRAVEKVRIQRENRILREEIRRKDAFGDLLGSTDAMRGLFESIRRVAPSNSSVVIRGESGTGKELVARAIVMTGPRSEQPFISLNCGAIPETLIEAELFGHEKGSFTGADASRAGHIEAAHGGTLFLDEIGSLPLPLQSKLLRVLEDRAVQRIGGRGVKKVDFRLITATNEDLEEAVREGRFREDLYYRIHVVPIFLPPLRERKGDIPLLVDHLLRIYCAANDLPLKHFEPEALEILEEHTWPGNVRELENLIQRLVLMVESGSIAVKQLPQQILMASTVGHDSLLIPEKGLDFDKEMARIETAYLQAALSRAGGKKVTAARLLRINPQKMKYLCRKYRIETGKN